MHIQPGRVPPAGLTIPTGQEFYEAYDMVGDAHPVSAACSFK
jgi:hypothetical protein